MSQRLLPLVRPIYESEGEIADAKKTIGENPALAARLEQQIRFDDQIVTELQAITLTDEQIERLENLLAESPNDGTPAGTLVGPETIEHAAVSVPSPPGSHPIVVPPPAPEPVHAPAPIATTPTAVPEQTALGLGDLKKEAEPNESKSKETETEQPAADAEGKQAKGTETAAKEEEAEKEEEPPRARTVTILTAVSVGIIATIALIAYLVWDQMNSFNGADQVAELLNSANTLNGDEFEQVSTTTANLKDWFFLKSDMRWFAVPREFADTATLGCRVFKFKGADIAQILAKGDQEVLMFLFHPADLAVRIRKGKWTIIEGENWVGGVTAVEDCCFIVAFKGKHSDMQAYLDKKLKK
jgi:hypothetical protein